MMNIAISRWKTLAITALSLTLALVAGCQSMGQPMARGMGMIPMGSKQDIADADQLWTALKQAKLVGTNAKKATPYKGQPPHGKILEILSGDISVDGYVGFAIVKRNYGGPGVSTKSVGKNRNNYLKAITVMYKRESGYDDDNKNWFWAKYKPNGDLHVKPKMGMKIALAGRVAKGKPEGCISCHMGAPGGDYVFSNKISIK